MGGVDWNTIHGALEALFPDGTVPGRRGYEQCPYWPTTVFGAVAYLLERGGVYHRIIHAPVGATHSLADGTSGNLVISSTEVMACRKLGERWYQLGASISSKSEVAGELAATFTEIAELWTQLISFHPYPVVSKISIEQLPWWLPALKLLIVADEASRDLGFAGDHPFEKMLQGIYTPAVYEVTPDPAYHVVHLSQVTTFAPKLNTMLARVVPKSRTPGVGCTMRALSHNLALVPPEGIVDMRWYRELRPIAEDLEPLNLLLIPFPYHIPASAFRSLGQTRHEPPGTQRWGWFTIDQTWLGQSEGPDLRELFAEFVCELLDAAEADVGRVHGIVLPEYSLDWQCYAKVISAIQKRHRNLDSRKPPVDFLVAGLSCNESRIPGNYVATTTFSINDDAKCVAATYRRHKHHRWQLNGSQVSEYALGSALDPNVIWWEATEIPNREVNLTVFRKGAVFSAMICEDLARSEPCHEPLRSVGPNLVFVILMDGPQLPARWAARYATTLADDPGSSVLTLTSLGLIDRSNDASRHPPSRHVSIWKDDSGHTVQLECPKGAQAILVTLSGSPAEEATLDGRPNNDTQAWRYRGHQSVRLRDTSRFSELLFLHK